MADALLTLTMPLDVSLDVEDLLLAHPELVRGFSSNTLRGHGSSVPLTDVAEQVRGSAPRFQIRLVAPEEDLRKLIACIREELPRARVIYWLIPVIEMGRL